MKTLIFIIISIVANYSFSQDTTIITNREKVPLQAVLDFEGLRTLFVGQEYTIRITTSGYYDIRVDTKNAKLELDERSKRSTGGLTYILTPIDTGNCIINLWNRVDAETTVSLKSQFYKVINYTVPPIHLNGLSSGVILNRLSSKVKIRCAYPPETGIEEHYPIIKWEATIGDRSFQGNGDVLSEELIDYANQLTNEYLHVTVYLDENKTGFSKSEGIYILRLN